MEKMENGETTWRVVNKMIAANANTVFNAIDYEPSAKLLAYAASNTVLILDPTCTTATLRSSTRTSIQTPKVLFALNTHTTRVNGVQWLSPSVIVSIGGDEKVIVVWRADGDSRAPTSWKAHQVIPGEESGHKATLTHLRAFYVSEEEQYFTTMDVGGDLRLWSLNDSKFVIKASLMFGRNLQETT